MLILFMIHSASADLPAAETLLALDPLVLEQLESADGSEGDGVPGEPKPTRRARRGRHLAHVGTGLMVGGGLTLGLSGVATWMLVARLGNGGYPGPFVLGIGGAAAVGLASVGVGLPLWLRGRHLQVSAAALSPTERQTGTGTERPRTAVGAVVSISARW